MVSSDRRQSPRFPLARPVKLRCMVSGRYYGGQSRDVSSTGVMTELDSPSLLVPGQRVAVGIAEHQKQPIIPADDMIEATVVRSLGLDGLQRVALQFDQRQQLAAAASA